MTPQEWTEGLQRSGVFNAIVDFVAHGQMTKEEAAEVLARAFEFYSERIREAKSEVVKIGAALDRMSFTSKAGERVVPWIGKGPHVDRLASDLRAVDGWVISLYETDLTMMRFGAPEHGRTRPYDLAKSMDALWEKRLQSFNMRLKDTSLFKLFY